MPSAEIPVKHNGLCRMEPSGTMEDPQDSRSFQSVSELQFGIIRHSLGFGTYRTLLDETGAPMKVQQELMRHASIQTTMNVYGQALSSTKRQANSKVVQMVLNPEVSMQTNEKGADVAAP
jgi:hypothetical protein